MTTDKHSTENDHTPESPTLGDIAARLRAEQEYYDGMGE